MKNFSTEVAGIDEAAVTAAANAGSVMAEMAGAIPNTGGVAAFFAGDNDMATFGTQLVSFGTAMKDFSSEVSGIDSDAVTAAATAGSTLADMAKNLPESGGLWSVFTADNDMSTFAKEIKKFGEGMKGFSEEVADVDESAITSTATTAKSLVSMANDLPSEDNIEKMKTFGGNLKTFGEKMSAFATEVEDIDPVQLSAAVTEIGKLGSIDISGLKSLGDTLSKIGVDSVKAFINAFTSSSTIVSNVGSAMVESLIAGITAQGENVTTIFTTIVSNAITAIKNTYNSFTSAGKYLVEGFAQGIDDKTFAAEAQAKAMALAALEAAKEALGIQSPSREARKAGGFFGEGMVLGIADYNSKVYRAGYNVAEMARDGLSKAISNVADLIETGMDTQPTIRPVLDLSEVTAGANSINGMFGMSPSIGVMSRIGSISARMDSRQNGSNGDVVSAIEGLGRKLGQTSGDTYNINGVTYDDGSNIYGAVQTLVHAAKVERRR